MYSVGSRGQMARRLATNQKIVGSIPTVTYLFAKSTSKCSFLRNHVWFRAIKIQ